MGLKVIGSGFGRTGTASLKIALEKLLDAPCYHMSEVLGRAGHIDLWLKAAAGEDVWDDIFDSYASTVDFPASNYWRQLAEAYPEARIVHSVRDPERWFTSTQETIFSEQIAAAHAGTKWGQMLKATIDDHVGGDLHDKETVIAAFEAQTAAVTAAFGPERVLVFEARQGWAPLCEFLGVPVPDEPYPHVNSKEEFDSVFDMLASPMGAAAMNGEGIGGASMHDEVF